MEAFWFAGCPRYKDNLVKTLKEWYPRTSEGKFEKMNLRQLKMIYATTIKTRHRKAQDRAQKQETGPEVFWPAKLKEVLKKGV